MSIPFEESVAKATKLFLQTAPVSASSHKIPTDYVSDIISEDIHMPRDRFIPAGLIAIELPQSAIAKFVSEELYTNGVSEMAAVIKRLGNSSGWKMGQLVKGAQKQGLIIGINEEDYRHMQHKGAQQLLEPEKGAKIFGCTEEAYMQQMRNVDSEAFRLTMRLIKESKPDAKGMKDLIAKAASEPGEFMEVAQKIQDIVESQRAALGISNKPRGGPGGSA